MQYIGFVRSCYPDKFGTPRQPGLVPESKAFLEIKSEFQPEISLQGLEGYSHVWLIFVFHENKIDRYHAKVHPPRLGGETMGLFATRTPHRPNPIGLSLLEIESVTHKGVWVRGVDVIDGTPILDIKPYLPNIESKPDALGGWTDTITQNETSIPTILWKTPALKQLEQFATDQDFKNTKDLIEHTIQLDPRPLVYRNEDGSESHYRDTHVVRIHNLDIEFQFHSRDCAQIINIQLVNK